MSKHHNYTNYSKNSNATTPPEVEDKVEVVETVVEPEASEPVVGIVSGCVKLNVRKNPHTNAEVLCVIDENSEVVIDEENSTHEFYKICTEAGVEGFCMKKFINVKS